MSLLSPLKGHEMPEQVISMLLSPSGKWRLVVVQREDGRFTYRCQIVDGDHWGPSGNDAGMYDSAETAESEARATMAKGKFPVTIAWMPELKAFGVGDAQPITYRDFYDVPRLFAVEIDGQHYLFDCAFDPVADEYAERYEVYHLFGVTKLELDQLRDWRNVRSHGVRIGSVEVAAVAFDETRRKTVKSGVLNLPGMNNH